MGRTTAQAAASLACFALLSLATFAQDSLWDELTNAGHAALEQRRYDEAERQLKAALDEAEGFGPRDPHLVTSLRNLVEAYHRQGKLLQQEPLRERMLEVKEDELGPSHPDVIPPLLELAGLYQQLQKPAEAEPLFRRVLESRESTLGPIDAQTIETVNKLGYVSWASEVHRG